ncbi:hypothetical protein ABZ746_38745 [Streptomyces sp. NPDC020096]
MTTAGRVWAHGRPECSGPRQLPRPWWSRRRVWPDRLRGRRVVTLPDIGVWESSRVA